MKTFTQIGEVITLTAPSGGVVTGKAYLIGALVIVAVSSADEAALFSALVTGVVEHAKVEAQAWTEGAKIYWANGTKLFTTVAGGNTLCGVAARAAANPSLTGFVRLDGVAR